MDNYEEISLKELFQVLWSGKIIIALFMIGFLIIGTLTTYFVLDKEYKSEVTFVVDTSEYSLVSYVDIVNPSVILESQLFLDILEDEIGTDNLEKYFDVSTNEGQVDIIASATRAAHSDNLADAISNLLVKYYEDDIESQFSLEESRLIAERDQLLLDIEVANNNYLDFVDENGHIDILKAEMANIRSRIIMITNGMITLESEIEVNTNVLATLNSNYDLSDILTDEINLLLTDTIVEELPVASTTPDMLIAIEATNTVVELTNQLHTYKTYSSDVVELEDRYSTLETTTIPLETEYEQIVNTQNDLQNDYNKSKKALDDLAVNQERLGSVVKFVDVAPATEPTSPNNIINMAISIVLGGFIGILYVFIKKYWTE